MNNKQPKKVLEELRKCAFNRENAIVKAAKAENNRKLTKLRKELKTAFLFKGRFYKLGQVDFVGCFEQIHYLV